ncbi:MAG: COX15/CtaA family protein [Actinomycetes bacterium]
MKPWQYKVLVANIVAQCGIVVTGAIVRLTSSGLGCPTWPDCVPGSITPTSDQTQAWHKYIEFGNRLLTFVLVVVAILTIVAMRGQRQSLRRMSLATLVGIFAQAVLGGVTVLTGLNPLVVASHFLLSVGLIAIAVTLHWRSHEEGDNNRLPVVAQPIFLASRLQTWLALIIIVIGTLVTGTGPHAGDSAKISRLPFDPRMISWFHSDVVVLFIGLSFGIVIAMLSTHAAANITRAAWIVIAVSLGQGLIGYVQYFTGLPWVLVACHVLGAVVLWVSVIRLRLSCVSHSV